MNILDFNQEYLGVSTKHDILDFNQEYLGVSTKHDILDFNQEYLGVSTKHDILDFKQEYLGVSTKHDILDFDEESLGISNDKWQIALWFYFLGFLVDNDLIYVVLGYTVHHGCCLRHSSGDNDHCVH